jgi:hypothetical protein
MTNMNNVSNGRLPNGQMPPGAQGMPFNAQQAAQQQRQGNMAPPPAPIEGPGAPPAQRAQESSPAQQPAPPTPSQANKANPKKKEPAKKKNAPKKGASATAATPTESADAPVSTPATPMTPSTRDTFPKSLAPPAPATQTQAAPPAQLPQPSIDHNAGMFDIATDEVCLFLLAHKCKLTNTLHRSISTSTLQVSITMMSSTTSTLTRF